MHAAINNFGEVPRVPIQAILRRTPDLPSLPAATLRVIQLTGGSDATSRSIGDAIGLDQALASKVLRLANSAYFGMNRQVTSLNEAVMLLGFRTIRHMALVAGTYPWMSKALKGYDLPPKALLMHSLGIATAAKMIARIRKFDPDTAFVAGLLADIGKVAISACIEDKVALMFQLGLQAGMSFEEVEERVVGHSHSEVGAHMVESWNLPEELVDGIRWHHDPVQSKSPWLAHVLHLADFIAMTSGCGLGGDGLLYEFCPESLEVCGFSSDDLDGLLDDFVTAFQHAETLVEGLQS